MTQSGFGLPFAVVAILPSEPAGAEACWLSMLSLT
jgi:hypothetical protein